MIPKSWQPGPLEERPPPELRERLLQFGGGDACRMRVTVIPREQLDNTLLKDGALIDSNGAVFSEDEPSQCGSNISTLWRERKLAAICYGYVLSNDGLWREQWWGTLKGAPLVETRGVCFGVRFRGASANTFASCFLGVEADPEDPDVGR